MNLKSHNKNEEKHMNEYGEAWFKNLMSLKQTFSKFAAKTFIKIEENDIDDKMNYEIEIKIEICKIFLKILEMREEYLINNAVEHFYKEVVRNTNPSKKYDFSKLYHKIIPKEPKVIRQAQVGGDFDQ